MSRAILFYFHLDGFSEILAVTLLISPLPIKIRAACANLFLKAGKATWFLFAGISLLFAGDFVSVCGQFFPV